MIELFSLEKISSIYLTVTLIIYLMIAELSRDKIKKSLFPAIIALLVVFIIVAAINVYNQIK